MSVGDEVDTSATVAQLNRQIGQLRSGIAVLREHLGEIAGVLRLAGDVDRLELDLSDLAGTDVGRTPSAPLPFQANAPTEIHVIDDRPLDRAMWADADDEGLGGYHR